MLYVPFITCNQTSRRREAGTQKPKLITQNREARFPAHCGLRCNTLVIKVMRQGLVKAFLFCRPAGMCCTCYGAQQACCKFARWLPASHTNPLHSHLTRLRSLPTVAGRQRTPGVRQPDNLSVRTGAFKLLQRIAEVGTWPRGMGRGRLACCELNEAGGTQAAR